MLRIRNFEVLRITEISSAAHYFQSYSNPQEEVALWFFSDTKSDIVVKGEYGKMLMLLSFMFMPCMKAARWGAG